MLALVVGDKSLPMAWESALTRKNIVYDVVNSTDDEELKSYIDHAEYDFLIHGKSLRGSKLLSQLSSGVDIVTLDVNLAFRNGAKNVDKQAQACVNIGLLELAQSHKNGDTGFLRVGPYEVDLLSGTARVDGHALDLIESEFSVFRALCAHSDGQYRSKFDLLSLTKGSGIDEDFDDDLFVDPHDDAMEMNATIRNIQSKIESAAGKEYRIPRMYNTGLSMNPLADDYRRVANHLSYNPHTRRLKSQDKEVTITPRSVLIMDCLIGAQIPVSREVLMQRLNCTEGSLKVQMTKVRNSMQELVGGHHITNVYGEGYMLVEDKILPKPKKVKATSYSL